MSLQSPLLQHPAFVSDFELLKGVSLNPARHTAPSAHAHSLAVSGRALALAAQNACSLEQSATLRDLGLVHDIGKAHGTTAPSKSVDLLPRYGLSDPAFVELVRYHDINLPWHTSVARGEPPSDRAWRKLASRVDVRLLCIFMVADRVDCPGGWQQNAPLVWFLAEVQRRGLLPASLRLQLESASHSSEALHV
jgi:hypothetical protein